MSWKEIIKQPRNPGPRPPQRPGSGGGTRDRVKDPKLVFREKVRTKPGGSQTKDRETAIDKKITEKKSNASKALTEAKAFKDSDKGKEMIEKSADPKDTAEQLEKVIAGLESGAQTGTIQLNKGGLMTKAKKKK